MSTKKERDAAIAKFKKKQKKTEIRKPPTIQKVIVPGTVGRPTDRDPEVEYVKISAVIEVRTKRLMGQALNDHLADDHKTQNDLINTAILEYIQNSKVK